VPKPLNIKSFLPQREIEICQRVREVRLQLKWKQSDFSKELGISRVRLASYEYAKAPIRYDFANRLCSQLNISQSWLAEGGRPLPGPYLHIHSLPDIAPRIIFSEAYDRFLKPALQNTSNFTADRLLYAVTHPSAKCDLENYIHLLTASLRDALNKLPTDLHLGLFRALSRDISAYKVKCEIERREGAKREPLDKRMGVRLHSAAMPKDKHLSRWAELCAELLAATSYRGGKAALARVLHVTRQQINDWLSGRYEPSADVALRMHDWVHPKPENKSPSSASTPLEPNAQRKASYNEIPNVRQKKRYQKARASTRAKRKPSKG